MTKRQKSYCRQLRVYSLIMTCAIAASTMVATYGEPVMWGLS